MRRTILFSFLVIGAVLAVVFGAGSFATFSDTESVTGTASAGNVDIQLNAQSDTDDDEDGESLTLAFGNNIECSGDDPFLYFAPGDSCVIEVIVSRDFCPSGGGNPDCAKELAIDLSLTDNTTALDKECDNDAGSGEWSVTFGAWDDTFDSDAAGPDPDDPAYMPAAEFDEERFTITVALDITAGDPVGSVCETDTLAVSITVTATQDAQPHNTEDDNP